MSQGAGGVAQRVEHLPSKHETGVQKEKKARHSSVYL
jgi:hypothetical protein